MWAGLITASSLIFTVSARAATVDSALVFLTTAAMLAFFSHSRFSYVAMYACLGVTVLGKGPVGVVLPMAVLGLFLAIMNHRKPDAEGLSPSPKSSISWKRPASWKGELPAALGPLGFRNLCRSAWQLRPLTGMAVVLAIALPWYAWVGVRTDGEWPMQFFFKHNFQRALSSFETHSGPIYYYVLAIAIGFFPWSVFLGPSIANLMQRLREKCAWKPGYIFIACWIGLYVAFWTLIRTKLPHYVLPAYPALALLTACFMHRWLTEPATMKVWWLRNAWISLVLVGAGIMVAFPIIAAYFLPGEAVLGLVGLIPLIGGAVLVLLVARSASRRRDGHGRHGGRFSDGAVWICRIAGGSASKRPEFDGGHRSKRKRLVRSDDLPIPPREFRLLRRSCDSALPGLG